MLYGWQNLQQTFYVQVKARLSQSTDDLTLVHTLTSRWARQCSNVSSSESNTFPGRQLQDLLKKAVEKVGCSSRLIFICHV